MKTTENSQNSEFTKSDSLRKSSANLGLPLPAATPLKSVRPQKSMMRLKSLKPRSLRGVNKVVIK